MNVLDENILESQRRQLRAWRVSARKIGHDIERKGISDSDIITSLLRLPSPTFFTRDLRLYRRGLCHQRYCIVVMEVPATDAATYARRLLRHPALNSRARRMGAVVPLSSTGLVLWRLRSNAEIRLEWTD